MHEISFLDMFTLVSIALIVILLGGIIIYILRELKDLSDEVLDLKLFPKKQSSKTSIEEVRILLSDDKIVDKINGVLNSLIKDAADRYMLFEVGFNGTDAYIPSKSSDEMEKYIYGTVRSNITSATRDLLGLIYDVSTEEKLNNVIELAVKMYMIDILVKTNQSIPAE